jgi:hypothetical protein
MLLARKEAAMPGVRVIDKPRNCQLSPAFLIPTIPIKSIELAELPRCQHLADTASSIA